MAASDHLNGSQFSRDPAGAKMDAGNRRTYRLGLFDAPTDRVLDTINVNQRQLDDPESSANKFAHIMPELRSQKLAYVRGAKHELHRRANGGKVGPERYLDGN